MVAEPWKVKVRFPTWYRTPNTKASATTLGRIPVVDPEPYTPCSLTFKAQNTVTNVAEMAVNDHGSQDIDVTIEGHLQETGQPRRGQTQNCGEKLET